MRRQRRQNTRLNLGQDSLGAGVAYSQSGFNDLGGILSEKIQQGTAKVASFEKQRRDELKLEEEKAGLMVEGFMANQAEGIDLTAIPDEDKGMITEFSMNQKQIYADAAQAAGGMKAGSPEKLEQIAIMKQANQRLQNVEKQYNAWGGMREDYMQDFQSKNLSVANSSGNMISAANIFTGAQQRSFDENGNIMFTDEAGNVTAMSDIKQPFEKAYKEANYINETMFKIYNKGQKLDDTEKTYLRNSLSTLIDNAGVEGLQSLAFDKLVGKEAFFNEEERYLIESLDTTNPEELIKAKKDLKEVLLNKMIDVADQQAISGFNKKQSAIKSENDNIKDFRSIVVTGGYDPNKRTPVNVGGVSRYNEAVFTANKDFRITPLDTSENPDISKGIMVTDSRGGTIGGPFYTEEKLAEFLNRQQSQK